MVLSLQSPLFLCFFVGVGEVLKNLNLKKSNPQGSFPSGSASPSEEGWVYCQAPEAFPKGAEIAWENFSAVFAIKPTLSLVSHSVAKWAY